MYHGLSLVPATVSKVLCILIGPILPMSSRESGLVVTEHMGRS